MRILLILLLTCTGLADAAVLRVGNGCTYTTIQDALQAAQSNDELRLRTQTFFGNLVVTKPLTIRGGYASCTATSPTLFNRASIQATQGGMPIMLLQAPNGSTIRLERFDIFGGLNTSSADGRGGGMRIGGRNRLEVDLVSVYGNIATLGGGIYIDQGSSLVSTGGISLTVSDNTSGSEGGGIYVSSGATVDLLTQPLATVNIDRNDSNVQGGAVFFGAADVRIANASFDGNAAPDGGAIANALVTSASRLEIANSSFSNNMAKGTIPTGASGRGGGLQLQKGTAAFDVILRDISFTSNQAGGSTGLGGAADLVGDVAVDLTGVSFSMNSAASGGALSLAGARLQMTGGTFSQNHANVDGGAIYSGAGSRWDVLHTLGSPVLFAANSATGRGGAIYDVSAQTNQLAPGDITGSTLRFLGNQANQGGAIYLSGGTVIGLSLPTRFDNNVALADGGAIYATGANTVLYSDGSGSPASRLEFTGNQAATKGGAVYINNAASARLDWVAIGVTGAGNSAQVGAGVYFEGSGTLNMRNSAVVGNSASVGGGGLFLGPGARVTIGAVHGPAAQVPLPGQPRNCDLLDLTANQYCSRLAGNQVTAVGASARGGAIQATFTNSVSVTSTHLDNNVAGAGAALAVLDGAEVLLENSLVEGQNNAIYLDQNASLDIHQSTLTNNGNNTLQIASHPSALLQFRSSILWGNTQGMVGGTLATLSGSCNITQAVQLNGFMVNPEFTVDARGSYRLAATSPAVNACLSGSSKDMDGRNRPYAGNYDMGAFERTQTAAPDAVFANSFE
jgi:predicted outer membrane repeat protein